MSGQVMTKKCLLISFLYHRHLPTVLLVSACLKNSLPLKMFECGVLDILCCNLSSMLIATAVLFHSLLLHGSVMT